MNKLIEKFNKLFNSFFSNSNTDPNELQKKRKKTLLLILGGLFAFIVLAMNSTTKTNPFSNDAVENKRSIFKDSTTSNVTHEKWTAEAIDKLEQSQKLSKEQIERTKVLEKELLELKESYKNLKNNNDEVRQDNTNQQVIQSEMQIQKNGFNFTPPNTEEIEKDKEAKPLFVDTPKQPIKRTQTNYIMLDNVLESIKINDEEEDLKNSDKEAKNDKKDNFIIPATSVLKAVLLSGFDAPTLAQAKTNPAPILLKVTDLSIGANQFSQDLRDCFILAEGYGDLSSERAYLRTTTLSCVNNDSKNIVADLSGFVSGEDGKNGLRGRVVTKQGALISRTIIAGFLSGIGEAFSNRGLVSTTTSDGNVISGFDGKLSDTEIANQGLGKGISNAAEKLADFYLKMADQISPVIEISANREVDIILTKNLVIDFNGLETLKTNINNEE
ncbi:TraB/VirB10 family protein [Campylobacter sp. MG1]|uniref:TraB/VirB10 family protein n=1 Tax=Campylobacter sp. MG1 TaxID=2976332 RepID=UPI00226D309C|nr:TraB/VirB10 family protein [Campylobacter sp. MG1]